MPVLLFEALRHDATIEQRAAGLDGVELGADWLEAARARQAARLAALRRPAHGLARVARAGGALVGLGVVCAVALAVLEAWR
jgi:hypothetical protein